MFTETDRDLRVDASDLIVQSQNCPGQGVDHSCSSALLSHGGVLGPCRRDGCIGDGLGEGLEVPTHPCLICDDVSVLRIGLAVSAVATGGVVDGAARNVKQPLTMAERFGSPGVPTFGRSVHLLEMPIRQLNRSITESKHHSCQRLHPLSCCFDHLRHSGCHKVGALPVTNSA